MRPADDDHPAAGSPLPPAERAPASERAPAGEAFAPKATPPVRPEQAAGPAGHPGLPTWSPGSPGSGPPAAPAVPPPHRWGLGAYGAAWAVFMASSLLLGALFARPGGMGVGGIVASVAVPTLLSAGTAVAFTIWRGNGPRVDLGLRWVPRDLAVGAALGAGGLVLSVPASLIYATVVGADKATSAVGEVFRGVQVGWPVAFGVFVLVVFVAPVCEEIVYRGLLWGAVERLGANRWVAFLITTMLFAMAHLELTRTPLLFVIAIPIGLARLITGRLPAGIVAHQINNLLPGLVLALALTGAVPL